MTIIRTVNLMLLFPNLSNDSRIKMPCMDDAPTCRATLLNFVIVQQQHANMMNVVLNVVVIMGFQYRLINFRYANNN